MIDKMQHVPNEDFSIGPPRPLKSSSVSFHIQIEYYC